MFDRYLIDMFNEEHNLARGSAHSPTGRQRKFTPAFGEAQIDEIGDILYSAVGKSIYYHEHRDGCETFFFLDGEWEGYAMGKRFPIHPGDILHIQPWQGHGFQTLEDHGRVLVMFQSKDMRYCLERNTYLREHHPEYAASPAHRQRSLASNRDLMRSLEFTHMESGDAPCHRRFGSGISTHHLPGLTMHLTVGRYETHGLKEVWELELEKSFRFAVKEPRIEQRIFWVREGLVRFEIDGTVVTASPDHLVYVPPYHLFSFETLERANMVDMNCPYLLQDCLEEYEQLLRKNGNAIDDSVLDDLRKRFLLPPCTFAQNP